MRFLAVSSAFYQEFQTILKWYQTTTDAFSSLLACQEV